MLTEEIKAKAAEFTPALIEFRRDLHMHPELSNEEVRTAEKIAEQLSKIEGMEVTRGAAGTGVVALLKGTGTQGADKTVLLRADIDALPIEETTGLEFASQTPNVMHACGHDGHASWLLGSAMILASLRDQFKGTVKFVFQPAEEGGGGGNRMVNEFKVLENPAPDAVFACHAWPDEEEGNVAVAMRPAFGYAGGFSIKVIGKGGHGSWPHQCVDPIAVANQIYGGLQQIVSRQMDETVARVISVCTIHSGPQDKSNIIPDCCTMTGTIRCDDLDQMEYLIKRIHAVSEGIAAANDAQAEVSCRHGKAVINTPEAIPFVLESAAKIVGKEHAILDTRAHLGGEDFSEYTSRVPGVYMFAGIANDENRGKWGLHSSDFVLQESVIPRMAAVFAQVTLDYMEKGSF